MHLAWYVCDSSFGYEMKLTRTQLVCESGQHVISEVRARQGETALYICNSWAEHLQSIARSGRIYALFH